MMKPLEPAAGSVVPRAHELYVDSGYVTGEGLVDFGRVGIQLTGPVLPDTSWQAKGGYGREQFAVDWTTHEVRCPQGQRSQAWIPPTDPRGYGTIQVRFAARTCQACPVKTACTKRASGGRTLTLHGREEVETALQQRRREQQTPVFQQRSARRAGVEGTIAQAVSLGMRHARYVGKDQTLLQANAIAAAINFARLNDCLVRTHAGLPPRRKRAPSPFARLRALKGA
jgi:transposase